MSLEPEHKFKVGDRVRMETQPTFIGVVKGVQADGTILVQWPSGAKRIHWPSLFELAEEAPKINRTVKEETAPEFKVGDRVEWKDTVNGPVGIVIKVQAEGCLLVRWPGRSGLGWQEHEKANDLSLVKEDRWENAATIPKEVQEALDRAVKAQKLCYEVSTLRGAAEIYEDTIIKALNQVIETECKLVSDILFSAACKKNGR